MWVRCRVGMDRVTDKDGVGCMACSFEIGD